MSWQATLSAVIMLILELRTEKKEMKQRFFLFVAFRKYCVIGIKGG